MIQEINLGTAPNNKTGDPARLAGQKINENFAYIESLIKNQDRIIESSGLVLVGQDLTFSAGWRWMIGGVECSNPVDVTITIPLSAAGMQRFDMFVGTTSNTFQRIAGNEDESTPVKPVVPSGKVEITVVLVSDAAVGSPDVPVVGDEYVKKEEFSYINYMASHAPGYVGSEIVYLNTASRNVQLSGNIDKVSGFSFSETEFVYDGAPIRIMNAQSTAITLQHDLPGAQFKFNFPDETDFVLSPGETIEFSIRAFELTSGLLFYVGKTSSGSGFDPSEHDLDEFQNLGADPYAHVSELPTKTSDLENDSDFATTAYVDSKVSSVYKVKGSVANYASLPSSGNVAGDVWNLTDTGMNYVWTGSVWDALGSTIDISGKEDVSNKTDDIEANKTSSIKYASAKGVVDWIINYLFGNLDEKTTLFNTDGIVIGDSADAGKTKLITWENFKTVLQTAFDSIYGKKYGTRTVLSGTAIDWSTDTDVYTKTLTANTTLTDSNLPSGTNTRTITLSIDGAFAITFPAYYKHKGGTYNTAKVNQIVLQCVNGNGGSERVNYIINPDL